MLIGRPPLFGASAGGASLVAAVLATSDKSPTPASLGANPSDLAVVFSLVNFTITSGSSHAWSRAGGSCVWKSLETTDVGAPINISGGNWLLAIYRNANSLAFIENSSAHGALGPQTSPGFTKGSGHAGVLAATYNQASARGTDPVTGPDRWTQRVQSPAGDITLFDRLYPVNPVYPDGAPITWTANVSLGPADGLLLFELRA